MMATASLGLVLPPTLLPPLQKFFKVDVTVVITIDNLEALLYMARLSFWRNNGKKLDELWQIDLAIAITIEKAKVLPNFFNFRF